MQPTFMVIDDFLSNAMDVRNAALKLEYPTPETKPYFPGRNASQRLNINGLDNIVSHLVREKVVAAPGHTFGHCRIALENDEGEHNVHIDTCQWSAILYLTLPEHCQDGTNFYRHIPTGMDRVPLNQEELHQCGMKDFSEVREKILLPHTNDKSKWELTTHVPMKFNRLLLFRPWLYHNAGRSFGTTMENGRLIYPMFFAAAEHQR